MASQNVNCMRCGKSTQPNHFDGEDTFYCQQCKRIIRKKRKEPLNIESIATENYKIPEGYDETEEHFHNLYLEEMASAKSQIKKLDCSDQEKHIMWVGKALSFWLKSYLDNSNLDDPIHLRNQDFCCLRFLITYDTLKRRSQNDVLKAVRNCIKCLNPRYNKKIANLNGAIIHIFRECGIF